MSCPLHFTGFLAPGLAVLECGGCRRFGCFCFWIAYSQAKNPKRRLPPHSKTSHAPISHTRDPATAGTAMQHLLSALVQDQPGVLAGIAGMLSSRGFNIESLAVAKCERPRMSRMIFVVNGDSAVLEQ